MRALMSAQHPRGAPGVRLYRVWWLAGRAEAIPASLRRMRAARRAERVRQICITIALCAIVIVARWTDLLVLSMVGMTLPGVAYLARWQRLRARASRLRRNGARPGPWVWAIDAESAACTAHILAAVPGRLDQARRTPSMRIQSPSCSQRNASNHAA